MNDLVDTVFLFIGVAVAWIVLSVLGGAALLTGIAVLAVRLVQRRRDRRDSTSAAPDDADHPPSTAPVQAP